VVTRAPPVAYSYQPQPPRRPLAPIAPTAPNDNGNKDNCNYYPSPLQKPRNQPRGYGRQQPVGHQGRQRAPSQTPKWWG
jgi:hypothetical protein